MRFHAASGHPRSLARLGGGVITIGSDMLGQLLAGGHHPPLAPAPQSRNKVTKEGGGIHCPHLVFGCHQHDHRLQQSFLRFSLVLSMPTWLQGISSFNWGSLGTRRWGLGASTPGKGLDFLGKLLSSVLLSRDLRKTD